MSGIRTNLFSFPPRGSPHRPIMVKPGPKAKASVSTPATDDEQHRGDLRELLRNKTFADVKIKCKTGEIIEAHKCILAARCEFFKAAFDNSLGFQESASGMVHLEGDSYNAVRALIEWIYGCDYNCETEKGGTAETKLFSLHFEVYSLALRFTLPDLNRRAKWKAQLMPTIDAADFCHAVSLIYSQPEVEEFREWRETLVSHATKHGKFLTSSEENRVFRQQVLKYPAFLLELATKLMGNTSRKTSGNLA